MNEKNLSVVAEVEREMIRAALEAANGNMREAARALRMPKSTVFDRVRQYGIKVAKPPKQRRDRFDPRKYLPSGTSL